LGCHKRPEYGSTGCRDVCVVYVFIAGLLESKGNNKRTKWPRELELIPNKIVFWFKSGV